MCERCQREHELCKRCHEFYCTSAKIKLGLCDECEMNKQNQKKGTCFTCMETFKSRKLLFKHLKNMNHYYQLI